MKSLINKRIKRCEWVKNCLVEWHDKYSEAMLNSTCDDTDGKVDGDALIIDTFLWHFRLSIEAILFCASLLWRLRVITALSNHIIEQEHSKGLSEEKKANVNK